MATVDPANPRSDAANIVRHDPPVGAGADFVIRLDLAAHDMPGRGEQVWARQVGEHRFVLKSLPFFAYGYRLDDVVDTDTDFVVSHVVEPSGRRLLRIAADRARADEVHEIVHPLLERLHLAHEWRGLGYVAVDLGPDDDPTEILEALAPLVDAEAAFHEYA